MLLRRVQIRCSSVAAFLIILIVSPFGSVSSNNGLCRGRCCKGASYFCADTYYQDGRKMKCFCDESCKSSGDCCSDYEAYCGGEHAFSCEVSPWGPWSECSTACGHGETQRVRTIIRRVERGGQSCGPLKETNRCVGEYCPDWKEMPSSRGREPYEVAKFVEAKYRNKDPHSYCAEYRLIYVTRGCRYAKGIHSWANRLRKGDKICVSCHSEVRKMYDDLRCPGLGRYMTKSVWNAGRVSGCNGWWKRETRIRKCECDRKLSNSYTFF